MKTLLTFIGGAAVGFLAAAAIQSMCDEESDHIEEHNSESTDNTTEDQTCAAESVNISDTDIDEDLAFQLP